MNKSQTFYKFLAIVIPILLVGFCVMRLGNIKPYQVQKLLRENHPIRVSYEEFNKKYNDEDKIYILLSKDSFFSPDESKTILDKISQSFRRTRGINSLTHLANSKFIKYSNNTFKLHLFLNRDSYQQGAKEKLHSKFWENNLISKDEKNLLITVTLSSRIDRKKRVPLVKLIINRTDSIIKNYPGIKSTYIGTEVANYWFTHEMVRNAAQITPLLFFIFGCFFFFVFKSFKSMVISFTVIVLAYASTAILITFIEEGIGPYSNFALLFVIIVSTSDLIHFFIQYKQSHSNIKDTISKIRIPCLLTSITTAIGFSSLLINENLPLKYLGLYCICGTFIAYFLTFNFVPLAIKAFNVKVPNLAEPTHKTNRLWDFVFSNSKLITSIFLIASIFLLVNSTKLRIDDNTYNKFNSEHPLSRAIDSFKQKLNFMGSVDIIIRSDKEEVISPESIEKIKVIENDLEKIKTASHLKSFTQFFDNMKEELGDDFTPLRIDSIFSMLYDYGALNSLYKQTSNEIRTTLFLKSLSSSDLQNTIISINKLQDKYPNFSIEVNGFAAIRNYISQNVIKNFIYSIGLTFVLIFLVFLFLFRSLKWSLLAILPNLLPLLVISGLMGFFNITIDNNLLILVSITLGISVDDTIHFIYKLRNSMKKENIELAIKRTFNSTLYPLLSTTSIFILTFPSFLISDVVLFEQVGFFLMISLITAFLADFFLLPSILLFRKKDKA